jgi:hypothetical protein
MKDSKRRLFSIAEKLQRRKNTGLAFLMFLTMLAAIILSSSVFERFSSRELAVNEPVTIASRTFETIAAPQNETVSSGRPVKQSSKAKLKEINIFDSLETVTGISNGVPQWLTTISGSNTNSDYRGKKEADATNPDEAAKFRRLQMKDEYGRIPLDGLEKARRQMDRMREFREELAQKNGSPEGPEIAGLAPGDWTWLGPGNIGGRIRSIVIDPNNANRVFAGSVAGGIWRTTDAGVTWAPVNDFMANLTVSTMVINPNNANIMYAGTGEGFGNVDALQGGGVFQSADGGATWNLLASANPAAPNPPGCGVGSAPCSAFWSFVNRLAISPNGATFLAATNGGIARSTDGGATWTQRTNIIAQDIDFDPNNSNNAVAGELVQCATPPGPPCAASARRSVDGGQTWTAMTFNPAITNGGTSATDGRVELAYAPSSSNIIYAAVNQNGGDMYRSADSGQNFTRVNTGSNYLGAQGWYDNIVWVNPQDPTFVLAGGIGLSRSADSGTTWTAIADGANGSAHADHHAIVAHPAFDNSTNKIVYFGNDGGIYRADDVSSVSMTSGWTELNNNLGITQFYGGAVTPTGTIFGGTQDNGNIKVSPTPNLDPPYDQQNWQGISGAGGDGFFVAADPADANYLYTEYTNANQELN